MKVSSGIWLMKCPACVTLVGIIRKNVLSQNPVSGFPLSNVRLSNSQFINYTAITTMKWMHDDCSISSASVLRRCSHNMTSFYCTVTAAMMLNSVWDPFAQQAWIQVYSWPFCISWVICMCPYFCWRGWQLLCMGISEPSPPSSTQLSLLSAECYGRGDTINIMML